LPIGDFCCRRAPLPPKAFAFRRSAQYFFIRCETVFLAAADIRRVLAFTSLTAARRCSPVASSGNVRSMAPISARRRLSASSAPARASSRSFSKVRDPYSAFVAPDSPRGSANQPTACTKCARRPQTAYSWRFSCRAAAAPPRLILVVGSQCRREARSTRFWERVLGRWR